MGTFSGIAGDASKIYGSALSDAQRNDMLSTAGLDQYMTENERVKKMQDEQKAMYGMKAGGKVSSASKRADGCAIRGKTKGGVR